MKSQWKIDLGARTATWGATKIRFVERPDGIDAILESGGPDSFRRRLSFIRDAAEAFEEEWMMTLHRRG